MCELFAMSSRLPADVRYSFEEFSRHGGLSGPHRDGWGIAWYDGPDVRSVREPAPASSSACVRFIQQTPITSATVISHIRRATQGQPSLRNTQPFSRELGGRMHVFAHNGDLRGIGDRTDLRPRTFLPVGDTDSEHAFCALMDRMREVWSGGQAPDAAARTEVVAGLAEAIRPFGPANFIYSDGELVFLHGHRRTPPGGGTPRPPGLHVLCRSCAAGEGAFVTSGLSVRPPPTEVPAPALQEVVLAASVPLTEEEWRPLDEGEVVVVRAGAILGA